MTERDDRAERDRARLRTVADYQFGAGAGEALFPPDGDLRILRTKSERPRQVFATDVPGASADGDADADARLVSLGTDGRFTLGPEGGRRLRAAFDPPRCRVIVGDESEPYVREGRNVFAKFVDTVDDGVRPDDEVLVVHGSDDLLAVGRAELPADAMRDFETGMAVFVRVGIEE